MNYYDYTPSLAAAVVFLILFGSVTGYHVWLLLRNKTWFFIVFVLGGICQSLSFVRYQAELILTSINILVETVGYVARAISANQHPNYTLMPFLIQNLLILLGPSLFAASIYMILGRIIRVTDGDTRSLIRGRFLTIIFVCGDVVSFLVQVGGKNPFRFTHLFLIHHG